MEYQKVLAENLEVRKGNKAAGASEDDIRALETQIGKTFPKSYREFLSLAGEYWPYDEGGVSEMEYLLPMQDKLGALLSKYGFELDRAYWAFSTLDFDQFHLFYWDEGDDPPVYLCMPTYVQEGAALIEKNTESMTAFVERAVNYFKSFEDYHSPT